MRAWAWTVAATVALSVAVIQTARLRRHATAAVELACEHRAPEAVESAYRNAALRAIRSEFASESLVLNRHPNGAAYMIVDTQCGPSAEAVVALSRAAIVPVVVASYVDAAGRLREWLRGLGVDLATAPVDPEQTPLRHLPRGITPIYLEVDEAGPIDIHAGAPKGEWLRQAPETPVRRGARGPSARGRCGRSRLGRLCSRARPHVGRKRPALCIATGRRRRERAPARRRRQFRSLRRTARRRSRRVHLHRIDGLCGRHVVVAGRKTHVVLRPRGGAPEDRACRSLVPWAAENIWLRRRMDETARRRAGAVHGARTRCRRRHVPANGTCR